MEKEIKILHKAISLLNCKRLFLTRFLFSLVFLYSTSVFAQNKTIKGVVVDEKQMPVPGATVMLKGNKSGSITNTNGEFLLNVPSGKNQTLVVSFIGMKTQEVNLTGSDNITIVLKESNVVLDDVVVVGYGKQKKESVVGSITQTSSKELERAGGVSSLGAALTGNLPGVVAFSATGMPGAEDPKIVIRSQTSWNNSDPLILVDGIERPMNTVDINSVESVSVLKDASATAIYGVRGANGVILINTKRGSEGKASINVRANMTAKVRSKLPEKYDSYDALSIKDLVIERELNIGSGAGAWASYIPSEMVKKYRYPANAYEADRYPNVDWEKELFKDYAMSYNASVNVSGGTKVVKYFASADYLHEGDLFKTFQNDRGYEPGYGYDRINIRSNLDFNLTSTTKFSTNLFGSNGVRKLPWGAQDGDAGYWISAYRTAPDAMPVKYSTTGMWSYYDPRKTDVPNSVCDLAMSGIEKRTTTQLNTDFILDQKLDMITKGLGARASFTLDNTFKETGRGINDLYNYPQRMWMNPLTGAIVYQYPVDANSQLDFSEGVRWSSQAGSIDQTATYRKQYYSVQLNYARKFGRHDVTALGLFSRDKVATGSEFPHYREDWAFRFTYNFATKYFAEINGAYNGSEKFGSNKRFAFFPSISGGWMVSGEDFMKSFSFIDMLKLRASIGKVGDDNVTGTSRWLYRDQWTYGGNAQLGDIPANTPYTFYRQTSLGNPNVSWETNLKRNFGVDFALLGGDVSGTVDLFSDKRSDILITGTDRAISTYFGVAAPVANLGKVNSHGYEIELKLSHKFANNIRLWSNINMTHAVNEVIERDDPSLLPSYQKRAGFSMGQTKAYIDKGQLQTWDDVYGSTARSTNNSNKTTGDYNIVDFNGDGVIDTYDQAPYQYSSIPQNTYNFSLGFEWKGLSCFVQFYGVNNVTREVTFPSFQSSSDIVYKEGTYWTKGGSGTPLPRWSQAQGSDASGTRYLYDGSYLRLKNAEVAYTFKGNFVKKIGMQSCRLYLNGDNLLLWTKMPDDRESNFNNNSSSTGAYPTVRRFNLGVDLTF
ncbi:MAG: TonB-dependent receptor [Bacteroidota bacterium]|nr:TonB-dependent receptor [Bacteroidota bacterium]